MSGSTIFAAGEVGVMLLAVVAMVLGARLAKRYRSAGSALAAGGVAWLLAAAVYWLQLGAILPALSGKEHEGARLVVSILGDSVYFGLGGIGLLLAFFAVVADRGGGAGTGSGGDGLREPNVVARRVAALAWQHYQAGKQRERERRSGL
ncbi:hypothetical protein KGQ20_17850 [Catenulispora sp. NF23]|uniref:Uncharacterized protein n=1 Tax=Catenulispora pinistramenti TaxID=2705254 RepID=A0ABS5KSQ4_9ACTN|nr:hypothetical protein [Catenulispora pinistramenti]MBS2534638.1 hypothetical protein [Catenulispora pinistramenti]MBS2549049.1 hypothetical protein [Catenulispora pinistramenti]